MTDREHALRARIDVLTDERDQARADLAEVRAKRRRLSSACSAARASRDLWRLRALRR